MGFWCNFIKITPAFSIRQPDPKIYMGTENRRAKRVSERIKSEVFYFSLSKLSIMCSHPDSVILARRKTYKWRSKIKSPEFVFNQSSTASYWGRRACSGTELSTSIHTETCTPIFTARLLLTANNWKQLKCPSARELIGRLYPPQSHTPGCTPTIYTPTVSYTKVFLSNKCSTWPTCATSCMSSRSSCNMKEMRHKRTCIIWCHLYVISKVRKFTNHELYQRLSEGLGI